MKSTTVATGALVTIVAGGAILGVQIQNQAEELQLVRQENQVLAAQAERVETLEADARSSRAEMSRLADEMALASVQISAPTDRSTSQKAVEPEGVTADSRDRISQQSEPPQDYSLEVVDMTDAEVLDMNDPTLHEERILRTANRRYMALFSLLKLPGDVQGQVRSMHTENIRQLAVSGTPMNYLSNGILDTEALKQLLSTVLTPDELSVWEAFENDPAYYHAEQRFVAQLAQFLPGLSSENRDVAARVLAEEYLIDSDLSNYGDDLHPMMMRWAQEIETLEQARMRIAVTYPDDEQYALFDDYVEQRRALIQAQMDR